MLHRNEKEKREISKLMEAFQTSVHAYYKVKCLSQFTIKKVNCRNLHPGIKETYFIELTFVTWYPKLSPFVTQKYFFHSI